jgi:hypothetical protein
MGDGRPAAGLLSAVRAFYLSHCSPPRLCAMTSRVRAGARSIGERRTQPSRTASPNDVFDAHHPRFVRIAVK